MKDTFYFFVVFSFLIFVTACDCLVHHQGYVIDSSTEKPIKNAIIKFDKRAYKTDTSGFFEIDYMTGICPDWTFQVAMENYLTEEISIELEDNLKIYKIKKTSKDNQGKQLENSLNFKIKNDTLYFFLTPKN